jgi:hypothetical protein
MKKTISLLLSIFLLTRCLFGQMEKEIDSVLKTKNFEAFKKISNTLSNRAKKIIAYGVLRDLTEDYQEGVFYFKKTIPGAIGSPYILRITLITTEKEIICYNLSEKKNKKVNGNSIWYLEVIDEFKNKKEYKKFKKSFSKIFLTDPNESELFTENITYGQACGFLGVAPAQKLQIDSYANKGDKENIIKWLQSPNTEKQIYAIDGLFQLKEKGVKLSASELSMIKFVINKKGTIHICSGCTPYKEEISKVVTKFNF